MLLKNCLHIAVAALLFSSCKDRHDDDVPYVTHFPMTSGNYWIYETFALDNNYRALGSTGLIDSCYVERDTTIAGLQYYKYTKPDEPGSKVYVSKYLRDSLGYLVDNNGTIFFATGDFTTIFYSKHFIDMEHQLSMEDTAYLLEQRMGDKDVSVTVPAGQFIASSWQSIFTMNAFFAQFAARVRIANTRYAAGVGMVTETVPFYAVEPGYRERRLIRYRVN